jgi:hypothetical protein
MYSKKSVGLIAVFVLVIAFLCANVGIGIERVEAAPNEIQLLLVSGRQTIPRDREKMSR